MNKQPFIKSQGSLTGRYSQRKHREIIFKGTLSLYHCFSKGLGNKFAWNFLSHAVFDILCSKKKKKKKEQFRSRFYVLTPWKHKQLFSRLAPCAHFCYLCCCFELGKYFPKLYAAEEIPKTTADNGREPHSLKGKHADVVIGRIMPVKKSPRPNPWSL